MRFQKIKTSLLQETMTILLDHKSKAFTLVKGPNGDLIRFQRPESNNAPVFSCLNGLLINWMYALERSVYLESEDVLRVYPCKNTKDCDTVRYSNSPTHPASIGQFESRLLLAVGIRTIQVIKDGFLYPADPAGYRHDALIHTFDKLGQSKAMWLPAIFQHPSWHESWPGDILNDDDDDDIDDDIDDGPLD